MWPYCIRPFFFQISHITPSIFVLVKIYYISQSTLVFISNVLYFAILLSLNLVVVNLVLITLKRIYLFVYFSQNCDYSNGWNLFQVGQGPVSSNLDWFYWWGQNIINTQKILHLDTFVRILTICFQNQNQNQKSFIQRMYREYIDNMIIHVHAK